MHISYVIHGGDDLRQYIRTYYTLDNILKKKSLEEIKNSYILFVGGSKKVIDKFSSIFEKLGIKYSYDNRPRNTDDDIRSLLEYLLVKKNTIGEVIVVTDEVHFPRVISLYKQPIEYFIETNSGFDLEKLERYREYSVESLIESKGIKIRYLGVPYYISNPRKILFDMLHEVLAFLKRLYLSIRY